MFLTFFPSRILAGPSMIGIKSPMTSKFPKNSDQTSSDLIFFAQLLHFLVLKKGEICFYQNNERAFAQSNKKEETV